MSNTSEENKRFQNIGCASKECSEEGRHYLKVLFLNKVGYFCDMCKTKLLNDNLVEEVVHETKILNKKAGLADQAHQPYSKRNTPNPTKKGVSQNEYRHGL